MDRHYQSVDERLPGIAHMKFFSVLVMVASHGFFWMITSDDATLTREGLAFTGFLASTRLPMLVVLSLPAIAGMVLRARLDKYMVDDRLLGFPLKVALGEALFLGVVESLVNLLTWGWTHIWAWDVLKFVAVSFLLIVVLARWGGVLWVAAAGISGLVLTPVIVTALRGLPPLPPAAVGTLEGILIGDNGVWFFWPLFPWFTTVAVGFLLAHVTLRVGSLTRWYAGLLATGVVCATIALWVVDYTWRVDPARVWGDTVWQPTLQSFVGFFGFLAIYFVLCAWLGRITKLHRYGIVRCYSRGILWIYALHIILGSHASDLLKGIFPTALFANLLWAMAFLILVMILMSWAIGFACVRFLDERRYILRVQMR